MIYGMYLSTMGAMVESSRHGVISNNLANSTTSGFKPDWTIYQEVDAESMLSAEHRSEVDPILERTGGGVWLNETVSNFRVGALRTTGNQLDMALQDGSSFFAVKEAETGETRYTRNGHFLVNENGRLVTTSGDEVLNAEGGSITLDGSTIFSVRQDGMLMDAQNNTELAQVGVWSAEDPALMTKIGDNLFDGDAANLDRAQSGVAGGMIEDSATEPITEMANMIAAHRAYEANMTFLKIQDQSLGDAVTQLGLTS